MELELSAAAADPVEALAMLAAYEVQAAEIAATKSAGLAATTAWTATAPGSGTSTPRWRLDHADWAVEALALLARDPSEVRRRRRGRGRGVVALPRRARGPMDSGAGLNVQTDRPEEGRARPAAPPERKVTLRCAHSATASTSGT